MSTLLHTNTNNRFSAITVLIVAITFVITLVLMLPTATSIVRIWNISDTFTHGFFVLPAFLYLAWSKRSWYVNKNAAPDWRVIPLIVACSGLWLLAQQSGIQVIEQIALVLVLILGIWAVVGTQIAKTIAFPLMFLIFLAPVGDELVPSLMELTADFTVWAVAMTGIPIYREGLYFSLPSGDWSVVEACSGVRYLISSIMLGSIYAYLNYTSVYRRIVFIAISAIVPLIANGLRAYLIVMLGHFSGNKLATGVDHLVYGWVFFGIIMFALFTVGALFHDTDSADDQSELAANPNNTEPDRVSDYSIVKSFLTWLIIIFAIAIGPLWSAVIEKDTSKALLAPTNNILQSLLPASKEAKPNTPKESTTVWEPLIGGFDNRLEAQYKTSDFTSIRALAYVYYDQKQGKEMINSANKLTSGIQSQWRVIEQTELVAHVSNKTNGTKLEALRIRSKDSTLNVLRWYSINGVVTNSPIMAKLIELRNRILLKKNISVHYILSTDDTNDQSELELLEIAKNLIQN